MFDRNRDSLAEITYTENSTTRTRNTVNHGMNALSPKAWTDVAIPERVRKVPKMVRMKLKATRRTVQILSISRLRIITSECTKAVLVSQGMSEAFSTGSQAQ